VIAAGIALIAIPILGVIAYMVRDVGWKFTAAVWGFALAASLLVAAGGWLIETGLAQ
jgi:hypothetical protein